MAPKNVVAHILQTLWQWLKLGAITLFPNLYVLVVSQQQAIRGSPYGNVKMKDKLATNDSRRHDWMA